VAIWLRVASILQQFTDEKEQVEVNGATVRECLEDLVKKYPEIRGWLFDANNSPVVWVLLNTEMVMPEDSIRPVKHGDEIEIFPMIVGG
jgi:molybdopterin converting factor small subunit